MYLRLLDLLSGTSCLLLTNFFLTRIFQGENGEWNIQHKIIKVCVGNLLTEKKCLFLLLIEERLLGLSRQWLGVGRMFYNLIFVQTCWESGETLSNIENKTNQIFCTSDRLRKLSEREGNKLEITQSKYRSDIF